MPSKKVEKEVFNPFVIFFSKLSIDIFRFPFSTGANGFLRHLSDIKN